MPGTVTVAPTESAYVPSFGASLQGEAGLRHWSVIALASLAAHLLLFLLAAGFAQLPAPARRTGPEVRVQVRPRIVIPLVAPPVSVLTQKDPNRGKLSQEFNAASLSPRPAQPDVPASPGAAAMPKQKFHPPSNRGPEPPRPVVPELPSVETPQIRAAVTPPPPALGAPEPAPPPQIQPAEKPKLAFEKPGIPTGTTGTTGLGRIPVPRPASTVEETARQVVRSGGRGLTVGDEEAFSGASPSSPSVPVPGKLGSAVELLSDPQGVDFRPYLMQILTTVRRNWRSIIPESARFGRQGRTTIQFAIGRDGSVPKLVIAVPSGAEALDRAAVAGISASNPFPPLPAEFRGGQIRLQFVFRYNVP